MSFILSKIFWAFFSPGNMLVLVLLLAGFLTTAQNRGWQRLGQKLTFNLALLLFFVAIFPVGDWFLIPLENRFSNSLPQHVDGIILLGGDENTLLSAARGEPIMHNSANRYLRFVELAHLYPNAQLIFTGGSGHLFSNLPIKEADIAVQMLTKIGLDIHSLVIENESHNTFENATKLASLLHPTPQQNWILVTSAWHMPRAVGCFRKAGWVVYPQSTGYLTSGQIYSTPQFDLLGHLVELNIAVHEYVGLIAYKLMGKTDQLWPS